MLTKKLRFSARAPPSKLVYIRAEGTLKNFKVSQPKMDILKYSKAGTRATCLKSSIRPFRFDHYRISTVFNTIRLKKIIKLLAHI